ncbi:BRO-N domain-containing protein [Desulfovibrio piger]|uniref:BRO-N domain-containing protein n=1 Tax=Desulfovibrio piger TaxID=901 RepID=UPI0026E92AAA|nr:BRO family protein [Desulfovibrio piger]
MSNLVSFAFEDNLVRSRLDENGEPWFVAKDVLKALDYAGDYNPSRALQAVPKEWKRVQRMHTLGGATIFSRPLTPLPASGTLKFPKLHEASPSPLPCPTR